MWCDSHTAVCCLFLNRNAWWQKKWRSKKRIPSLICHQRHPETGERGEAKLISVWPTSFVYHSSEGFKSTQWLRKRSLTLFANPNLTFSRAKEKCSSDKSPPPLTPPRKQQQQKNMYSFTCTAHWWVTQQWVKMVSEAPTVCPVGEILCKEHHLSTDCPLALSQVYELMIWPDQVSCFVPGFRCVIFTSTACTFRFLGGIRLTLYVTSSPSTGTYSPSMLKEKSGRAVKNFCFLEYFGGKWSYNISVYRNNCLGVKGFTHSEIWTKMSSPPLEGRMKPWPCDREKFLHTPLNTGPEWARTVL